MTVRDEGVWVPTPCEHTRTSFPYKVAPFAVATSNGVVVMSSQLELIGRPLSNASNAIFEIWFVLGLIRFEVKTTSFVSSIHTPASCAKELPSDDLAISVRDGLGPRTRRKDGWTTTNGADFASGIRSVPVLEVVV